jgi:NADP-dependent 3-hydroxy acid dehydrogenase YdfG
MANELNGAAAIVTGASSGIGRATALTLVDRGASVALVARRGDRLEKLAAEITEKGGRAEIIVADITAREQALGVVEKAVAAFGRLDVVVNAAGAMLNGPTEGALLDEWDTMVSINLQGLMYVTHAALPHLVAAAKDSGRKVTDLINISSVAGRAANAGVAAYNATKFGVTAFSEALRQEYAKHGVRVSVIEPGRVDTELFGLQQQSVQDNYEKMFEGIELLVAEDIAGAIDYVVTRPRRVAVNEIVIRPTDQAR